MKFSPTGKCSICEVKLLKRQIRRRGLFCSKSCQNEGQKNIPGKEITKEQIKDRRRKYHLAYKFGMTVENYKSMLKKQGNFCAICRKTPKSSLVIDHCHRTGRIRGLLCHRCNDAMGMGYFKDDMGLLGKTIKYIKKHELQ